MGIAFIIAIIILIAVFALALLVLANNRSSSVNQTFSALIFFVGFWLASSLFIDLSLSLSGIYFWAQISVVWAAAIPAIWVYFTYVFPRYIKLNILKQLIITIPPLAFLVLSPTSLNISSVRIIEDGSREIVHGSLYLILSVYFIIFALWGSVRLMLFYSKSRGVIRIQLRYMLIGILSSSLLAISGSILFPFLGVDAVTNFSSLTILFFLVFSVYAVLRHHLMQIRVMTAEVFTGLLLLILLVNVFTFRTKEQLILSLGLFFAAIIFGIFLVKSVLQEVNARREMEDMAKKLKRANFRLQRLDEAKSEFISIASHQLRTPLSAIKGYVSMILDGTYGKLDNEKSEVLTRVYASNERLIALVNDLLNLSRIERGKLQFEFQDVNDLSDILESVVSEFSVSAEKRGLRLVYKSTILPTISADPYKIRQIFVNIIDNAIKYTERGGLKISTEVTSKKITIIFKDTGVGMSHEEIDSTYEKFRRGQAGERFHAGGMGIGLYICHKIIEAHNGRIYARSKGKDEGSTFYVELPVKPKDQP
jgi:signal transduction histidine kinase